MPFIIYYIEIGVRTNCCVTRLNTRFMIIWVWELGDGLYYYVYRLYIYTEIDRNVS